MAKRGRRPVKEKEINFNGGSVGAITIEPTKMGIELVSRATAARTPDVAMNRR
jgi:hypothetical protein